MRLNILREGVRVIEITADGEDEVPEAVVDISDKHLKQILQKVKDSGILFTEAAALYQGAKLLEDLAILNIQLEAREQTITMLRRYQERLLRRLHTKPMIARITLEEVSEELLNELVVEVKASVLAAPDEDGTSPSESSE